MTEPTQPARESDPGVPDDDIDAWERLRQAPYPDPALQDRGEVLVWTGLGIGLVGVGVVAASAICPPCMMGMAPLAAATAPGLIAAGAVKRWRSRRRRQEGSQAAE